ncbi:MAG: LuxR family transcriptional regulator [Alphaproteobacteria bacterium]|jgi:LuxR family transcriptional regulator|nr:LuxR family transcriptional regulator [Alphaproteobacteria bacterium]
MGAYALDVYDEKLGKAESFDEALDFLSDFTEDMGYTQVLYAYQPFSPRLPDGDWIPLKLNVRNFPAGWEREWEAFGSFDPYYRACFEGTLPIDWTDIQGREHLHPLERQAWRYLADMGLGNGCTIPVHLPGGRFAVVSAILERSDRDWEGLLDDTRDTLFQLTHLFHETIQKKGFEKLLKPSQRARLSPRERECLTWSAAGKTSPEIAVIIDRSVETVRLHLKNTNRKLGASNRAHAIAKAMQLGLMQPH